MAMLAKKSVFVLTPFFHTKVVMTILQILRSGSMHSMQFQDFKLATEIQKSSLVRHLTIIGLKIFDPFQRDSLPSWFET